MATLSRRDIIANSDLDECYKCFQSTNGRWKNYWWEGVVAIFESAKEFAERYILDPVKRTLTKLKKAISRKTSPKVDYNGVDPLDYATEKCYLVQVLNDKGEITGCKVGTTAQARTADRWLDWLRKPAAADMNAASVKVLRVYDCSTRPAEGLESLFRAAFIKAYPNTYKKNDRFFGVDFDLALADRLYAEYFAPAV